MEQIDKMKRSCLRLGVVLMTLCWGVSTGWAQLQVDVRCIEVIATDHLGVNLAYPSTIFYDQAEDEIYITDASKGQLVICTADYFPHMAVGEGRGLRTIYSCCLEGERLYVCQGISKENSRGQIEILNRAFLREGSIYFSGFDRSESFLPGKLAVGADSNLYVVGVNSSPVIVLDRDGKYLRSIIPRDQILGVTEPASIVSIAIGKDGRMYFLSEAFGRVFVYDRDERFLYKFGEKGGDRGKLARPRGIAVDDEKGRIYIVDYLRHTISVYSIDGKFLFDFGGKGYSRGWFVYPSDICIDGFGRLLITDTFNHRVQVFEVNEKGSDS